ncbi:hypothetical protein VSR68_24240 [Paraburkholderia phymatum]|uniref:hypothetical protein n=1 Tax=Paraburkholderia phymatum TaxID=148447 RepID=UPI00316E434F
MSHLTMDREKAAASLRSLALNSPNRSKAARLRAVLPDVEAALSAGVPSAEIITALAENGLAFTPRTFHGTLYRLRKNARPPTPHAPRPAMNAGDAYARSTGDAPSAISMTGTTDRIKTIEQLRAEHPTMPQFELTKLYAQQYDQPAFTSADIEELKRKYPPRPKA